MMLGDVALFDAFIDALDLASPLAARLKRAVSSPRRLKAELTSAAGGEVVTVRGGDRLAGLLAGLSEADAALALEDVWALAGISPVGGRSSQEIVHRLAEGRALAEAPRLTPAQHDLITRYLAISDAPAKALQTASQLAGGGLAATLTVWEQRLAALKAKGVPEGKMVLSTAFGRGFSYYDGVFFEVRSGAHREDAPVAAGGRYDLLPGRLGAKTKTGAVGCMVRPARAWAGGPI